MGSKNYIIVWLNITIFFLVLMILVGGITRLTNSGLSMVDWKPITGIVPPLSHDDWIDSFEEYKEFPEYKIKNYDMDLSDYKFIYFWEYIHRMLGRFFGFLFIIPFTFFLAKGYLSKKLIYKLLFLFVLGGSQGFVGWYMVKSGLVNEPNVSHYRLSLHLFLAFLILSYTYKLKLSIIYNKLSKINNYDFINRFSSLILILLFIQVIYGAFNAGLKTVHEISTFPFYNGMVFPFSKMTLNPWWLNLLENNFSVQLIHRYLGFTIVLLIGFLVSKINFHAIRLKIETQYIISLILYQCILGVLTLVSKAVLVFALMHQLLAIITILLMIRISHKLKYE